MFLFLTLYLFAISARADAQLVEGQEGVCRQTRIVPYVEYETREYYETRKEWCWDIFQKFRCDVAFPRWEQVPVNKEKEETVLVCCEGWEFENGACIRHPPLLEENEGGEEVRPIEESPAVLEPEAPVPMPEAPIYIPVVEVPAPTPAVPVEFPAESVHDNTETEVEVEPEHHEEKEETTEHEDQAPPIVVIPLDHNDDHNEKEEDNEHHEEQVEDHEDSIVVVPFDHNEDNNVHEGTVEEHHEEKEETPEHEEHPAAPAAPVEIPIEHSHPAPSPTTEAPTHEPNHPIFEEIMDSPHEPYHPIFEEVMETPQEPDFEEDHWREVEHQERQEDSEETSTDEQPKYHFEELIKILTGQRNNWEEEEESNPGEKDHWEEIPTEVQEEHARHSPEEQQHEHREEHSGHEDPEPENEDHQQVHWEETPTVIHEEPVRNNETFEFEAVAAANERFRAALAASQAAAEAAHRADVEAKAEHMAAQIAKFFAKVFFKPDPTHAPEQKETTRVVVGETQPHWLQLLQVLRKKESAAGPSEAEERAAEIKRKEMREQMEAYESAKEEQMAAEMVSIVAQELLKDLPETAEVPSHPEPVVEENEKEQTKPDEHTHVEEPLAPSLPEVEKVLQDTMADLSMTHIRMISRLHRAWASLHQHSPQEKHKMPTLD